MKIQRMLIIQLHAVLACFFMPMALLYFISGALYSFDIKGDVDKQVYTGAFQGSCRVNHLRRLSILCAIDLTFGVEPHRWSQQPIPDLA